MLKLDRRIEASLWILALAAIVVAGYYYVPGAGETEEEGRTVRIGYVSWAEGIAMTHLAKVVLEDRLGYNVELTMADPAPIFTSLAEGKMDFFLDAWLPLTHSSHMEKYGDILNDLGYNYEGARIGLVAPEYVEIDAIADLRKKAELIDGAITGIDSGAGIMEAARKAIDEYNLDMRLLTSSGAAMTASLSDSISADSPIVVTGWKPHWMFARWRLKFLDDPKKVFGEEENIHTMARPGISRDLPEVVSFFKNFYFNDRQIGTLMDAMNKTSSEETAARDWMKAHGDLVDSWIGSS